METSKACIDAAKGALKTFSNVDLEKYVSSVFNKAREYKDLKGFPAIDKAMKEVNDTLAQSFTEQMQIKVNTAAKFEKLASAIREKKVTLLTSLARRKENWSNNVESAQRASQKLLMDKSINNLTSEELLFVKNKKNDLEIMRALDGKEAHQTAKSIAKKFDDDYIEARNGEMVASDAIPLSHLNKDRSLRAIHDEGKMLRSGRNLIESAKARFKYDVTQAKNIWREYIKPLLHLEKTFEGSDVIGIDGKVNQSKVDQVLDEIFDNITTGKPEIFSMGGQKESMFFYWKDHESWMKYNQTYGKGDFLSAWRSDVHSSGNKIGMAKLFGDTPQTTYNELAELENKVNPQSSTTKTQAKLTYKWLAGIDKASVNPTLSTFFSSLNALTSSAKLLLRVTLLSLPDIANGIMFAHRFGYSYFKSYGTYLGGLFNAIPTEERKYLAGMFKEMTDTHMGTMSRYLDANNTSELINNVNNVMYRITLMDALDKGNKVSALQLMARIGGDNAHLNHGELPEKMRNMLDKFNISDKEWNVLRTKTKSLNGKKLFTLDNVDALTNEDLRKIYGINDTTMPLYHLKNELHRKVYSMFDVSAENSVLTPGAFMLASSRMGLRAGTAAGEILRSIMQFKMYPMNYIDRVLYQGIKNADGVQNKIIFGAALIGATLPMSWLVNTLDNLAKGKTNPDWNQMNFGERFDYSKNLLLPSLGFVGNFFSPDKPWGGVGGMVATPALQTLYNALKIPYRVAEGASQKDMKKIGKAFTDVAKNLVPGSSLPLFSPFMRQMLGDKPSLQPGQVQLYGA